ncbi:antibiotic biosynthesis monooxygenase [Yersinia intermedia]|nr:antibiotic biosynthesis monooxygenase [Yersinia intermedia]
MMKNEITCVFNLTINDGQFPAFKELVSHVVEATRKEPGTLSYVYSVSEDQQTAHIVERYRQQGLVSHVDHTFAPFAETFLSLVTITGLTVHGEPDEEIRKRLDPFGAVYMKPFDGFTR